MTEPAEALDPVEQEYMVAMRRCRDDMEAYELSIGLAEYRRMFKSGFVSARSRSERGREA